MRSKSNRVRPNVAFQSWEYNCVIFNVFLFSQTGVSNVLAIIFWNYVASRAIELSQSIVLWSHYFIKNKFSLNVIRGYKIGNKSVTFCLKRPLYSRCFLSMPGKKFISNSYFSKILDQTFFLAFSMLLT